jgi:hypothetical protein
VSDGREERDERERRTEQEKREEREDRVNRDDPDEWKPERAIGRVRRNQRADRLSFHSRERESGQVISAIGVPERF